MSSAQKEKKRSRFFFSFFVEFFPLLQYFNTKLEVLYNNKLVGSTQSSPVPGTSYLVSSGGQLSSFWVVLQPVLRTRTETFFFLFVYINDNKMHPLHSPPQS